MVETADIGCELVSSIILLVAFLLRPDHARCTRRPVGDPDWSWASGRPDRSFVSPGELRGHIYCTHGTRPIVIDDRAVGCQLF